MYESKHSPLLSTQAFLWRLLAHLGLAVLVIGVALLLGIVGHLVFEPVAWHDALLNTALILGGVGPYLLPTSVAGKVFFALYGMLVGLVFVATLGLVLAPVAHRISHKLHLEPRD
ncbi:MAG: two pore domain potassium channel family protein [Pigmentiphaga sp.]|nr:two pore domain potassium channel family protein [Pigmentiphaga sp.]